MGVEVVFLASYVSFLKWVLGRCRFSATLFLLWMPIVVNVVFSFLAMQVNGRSGEKVRCGQCAGHRTTEPRD